MINVQKGIIMNKEYAGNISGSLTYLSMASGALVFLMMVIIAVV